MSGGVDLFTLRLSEQTLHRRGRQEISPQPLVAGSVTPPNPRSGSCLHRLFDQDDDEFTIVGNTLIKLGNFSELLL